MIQTSLAGVQAGKHIDALADFFFNVSSSHISHELSVLDDLDVDDTLSKGRLYKKHHEQQLYVLFQQDRSVRVTYIKNNPRLLFIL